MRTTIDIEDRLLSMAKKRAVEEGTTLRSVVEAALRQSLFRKQRRDGKFRLRWKTLQGKRVPGVDVSDRDVLYERMEGGS